MKPRGLLGSYLDDRGLSYRSGLEVCLLYHTMTLVDGRWFVVVVLLMCVGHEGGRRIYVDTSEYRLFEK